MIKTYKNRIYLTKVQQQVLSQLLKEYRWLYKYIPAYRKADYEKEKRTIDWYETHSCA